MTPMTIFEPIIAVFAIAVTIGLPIVCVTILIAMRLRRSGVHKKDRAQWDEETRLMQGMHDDLTRMESRIEALETILLEATGKDKR